jgi:hypothetical protein
VWTFRIQPDPAGGARVGSGGKGDERKERGGDREGITYSDILFRLVIVSSVNFELLVDDVRDTLCVCFPLKTCSAVQLGLYIGGTDGKREGVILGVDRRGTTSV